WLSAPTDVAPRGSLRSTRACRPARVTSRGDAVSIHRYTAASQVVQHSIEAVIRELEHDAVDLRVRAANLQTPRPVPHRFDVSDRVEGITTGSGTWLYLESFEKSHPTGLRIDSTSRASSSSSRSERPRGAPQGQTARRVPEDRPRTDEREPQRRRPCGVESSGAMRQSRTVTKLAPRARSFSGGEPSAVPRGISQTKRSFA